MRRLALLALLAGLMLGAGLPPAQAAIPPAGPRSQAAGLTLAARAGFDGYYRPGAWMPVRITVANDGPDLEGTLRVRVPGDYSAPDTDYARLVSLPTRSRREIFLYAAPTGYLSTLQVDLLDADGRRVTGTSVRVVQVDTGDLLYGLLASSPSAYGSLTGITPSTGRAFAAQLEVADLPPLSPAWQGLDVLVISDTDTGPLSPEQQSALRTWVLNGGRLIVAGGPGWRKTAAGLTGLLPLAPDAERSLDDLGDLAGLGGRPAPDGPAVIAVGSLQPDALVLAQTLAGVPLISSRHLGYGWVAYLSADPAFSPLIGWPGVEGLLRSLLAQPVERPSWARGMHNWSQANDALNALPFLELPSIFSICGFLAVYALVIGPLNYLLLRRMRRRELAWVTVPALVLVFSLVAYFTGYQVRGGDATLHQLSVVQAWAGGDQAQVDQLVGVVSPRRASYDVTFAPGTLVRPLPYTSGPTSSGSTLTLLQADQTQVLDLRTDVIEVRSFVVQGSLPAPAWQAELKLSLTASGAELQGSIANLSGLALQDAVLLAPGGIERLGTFAAGETRSVSLALSGGRAVPALPSLVVPGGLKTAPVSAPSGYDSTIDDILGGSNYYNDREQFRRYSLLGTIIDQYGGYGRGGGVYLVGWSDQPPFAAQVLDRPYETQSQTLYLIALPPLFEAGSGPLTLWPSLFTWEALPSASGASFMPYDLYLSAPSGPAAFRFVPLLPLNYGHVSRLTLHLKAYGSTGPSGVTVEVWDNTEQVWAALGPLDWGDHDLQSPARFVGPGGQVQVRVSSPTSAGVSLEGVDLTLVAER